MLSEMARRVFADLYSYSDETIDDTFKRVSTEFGNDEEQKIAFGLLKSNTWRPNSPVFFNAGSDKKIFSACWVTGMEDSMDSIYDVANVARKVFQSGAGIGIPIGRLREKEAYIYEGNMDRETEPSGKSSGPISFMQLFDAVGATTKSGGRARRAAIMMAMPINHPDVLDFIECKKVDGVLSNMNISVNITDDFMKAFKDNIPFKLISPSNGVVKEINARVIWDKLVDMAHKTADPGILFIDTINKFNPLRKIMLIETTNPCITGDALIMTDKGLVRMDYLSKHVGEYKVLSYDEGTNVLVFDDIIWGGLTKEKDELIELEIEENGVIYRIKCTPDHRIYTRNRGYVEAKDLTEEDDIFVQ